MTCDIDTAVHQFEDLRNVLGLQEEGLVVVEGIFIAHFSYIGVLTAMECTLVAQCTAF